MPILSRGGSGGSGFALGPVDNLFGTTSGNASDTPSTVVPAASKVAAEAVRDTYFIANPSNLAEYDANNSLNIRVFYIDAGNSVVFHQIRQGSEWVDNGSVTGIEGLPGSGTDFASISDNHIPAIGPGPDKLPFDSGLESVAGSTANAPRKLKTPGPLEIRSTTLLFDQGQAVSAGGENTFFQNIDRDEVFHPIWQLATMDSSGVGFNRSWAGPAVVNDPRQTVRTETLIDPTFSIDINSGDADGLRVFTFQLELTADSTDVELVIRRGPNILWRHNFGAKPAGLQDFNLLLSPANPTGTSPFDCRDGETYAISIVNASLFGDTNDVPLYNLTFRPWDDKNIALEEDILTNVIDLTANLNITAGNLETYNRATLSVPSGTSGTFDVNIAAGLDLEYFDLFIDGNSAVLLSATGTERVNNELDIRFTQHQGGRVTKVGPGRYGLVYSAEPTTTPDHPVTLRRDMPSEVDAQNLTNASLNDNSALWIISTEQLADSNRADATLYALAAGQLDADGNSIPLVPTAANTIRLTGGTIVRVFGANDFRVVASSERAVNQEAVRDIVADTLVAGMNVTIVVDDTSDTITINAAGGPGGGTPPPAPADTILYGLSPTNNPATVDIATLTTEVDPTNPDTIATGVASQGDFFILLVPQADDVTSIFDTVLNQDVTSIFTETDNVRILSTVSFKSYVIGPLNAGVNETYVINF